MYKHRKYAMMQGLRRLPSKWYQNDCINETSWNQPANNKMTEWILSYGQVKTHIFGQEQARQS